MHCIVFARREVSGTSKPIEREPNRRKSHQARIVGRGFTQDSGVDIIETLSPGIEFDGERTVLVISVMRKFHSTVGFDVGCIGPGFSRVQPAFFWCSDGTNQRIVTMRRECRSTRTEASAHVQPACIKQELVLCSTALIHGRVSFRASCEILHA